MIEAMELGGAGQSPAERKMPLKDVSCQSGHISENLAACSTVNCKIVDQVFLRLQFLPALLIEELDCLVDFGIMSSNVVGRHDLNAAAGADQPHADPVRWPRNRITRVAA